MLRRFLPMGRKAWLAVALATLGATAGMSAWGKGPAAHMRNIVTATVADVTLYDVRGGQGQAFLDAMVQNGPYNQFMAGAVSEKLLAPLPGSGARSQYVALSRYLDGATAKRVADLRDPGIRPLLNGAPKRVRGMLVQHVFADWGWEKGGTPKLLDVPAGGMEAIFEQRLGTLAYLITGYTGQTGMVEFFDAGHTTKRLRALLAARPGLAGASIYVTPAKSYFVYSEYFKSPAHATGLSVLARGRGQAGTVEANYAPR